MELANYELLSPNSEETRHAQSESARQPPVSSFAIRTCFGIRILGFSSPYSATARGSTSIQDRLTEGDLEPAAPPRCSNKTRKTPLGERGQKHSSPGCSTRPWRSFQNNCAIFGSTPPASPTRRNRYI